jgi:hypothetical protein
LLVNSALQTITEDLLTLTELLSWLQASMCSDQGLLLLVGDTIRQFVVLEYDFDRMDV